MKYNVTNYIFLRDPKDRKTLVILGTNASEVSAVDLAEISTMFPGYSGSAEEDKDPLSMQFLTRSFINLRRLQHLDNATCELIVKAAKVDNNEKVTPKLH